MSTILELAPQGVWKNFHALTQIPRPSGHCEQVSEYLVNFGKNLGRQCCNTKASHSWHGEPKRCGFASPHGYGASESGGCGA